MKLFQMVVQKLVRPSRSYREFHENHHENHLNLVKIVLKQYFKKNVKEETFLMKLLIT